MGSGIQVVGVFFLNFLLLLLFLNLNFYVFILLVEKLVS